MKIPLTTFKVGRGADCDVKLHDHSISRQHAVIQLNSDGSILLTDVGSSNGTFLLVGKSWKRIKSENLRSDQSVKFGGHEVRVSELISMLARAGSIKSGGVANSRVGAHFSANSNTSGMGGKESLLKPRRNPETGEIEEKK